MPRSSRRSTGNAFNAIDRMAIEMDPPARPCLGVFPGFVDPLTEVKFGRRDTPTKTMGPWTFNPEDERLELIHPGRQVEEENHLPIKSFSVFFFFFFGGVNVSLALKRCVAGVIFLSIYVANILEGSKQWD